ncbi:MAG TPA: DMT family transporter [Kiloniellales bacterium]|nr:DMT family transporter [Kiloniellales bacterium]
MSFRGASSQGTSLPLAYLLFGATILIWGTNWPIMKVGLTFIPPFWFAFLRVGLGCLTLFTALLVTGRLRWPARGDLPVVFSVGWLQIAAFLVIINLAVPAVGAGRSSILAYTTPLWVVPGAILFLGERLLKLKFLGLLFGMLGIVILFNPLAFDWADPAQRQGNLLLMLAALAWAAAILHIRSRRWLGSPLELAPWQLLVALPPLLLGALLLDPPWTPPLRGDVALILLHNGVLATGFAYWAAFTVTRSLPAISTSLGFLGVPLVGVASAALALGEPVTASVVAGLLAILLGVALVNFADLKRR